VESVVKGRECSRGREGREVVNGGKLIDKTCSDQFILEKHIVLSRSLRLSSAQSVPRWLGLL
jgi:hypothetical protein